MNLINAKPVEIETLKQSKFCIPIPTIAIENEQIMDIDDINWSIADLINQPKQ